MKALRVLGPFALTMISVNAVLNLRSLPGMASLGPASLVYFALAAVCFLLPSALICAELSTSFPQNGGIYTWVKQAFGLKVGFMAIWMEWSNNVISFPATLAAIIATLSYVGAPILSTNKWILFALSLLLLWSITAFNLLGIKLSSRLNILGALLGTIIPGLFIIGVGITWYFQRPEHLQHIQATDFWPQWHLGSLAIFVSTLSAYSGMQITAFHAQNVIHPKRSYPLAILLATLLILGLSVFATLAMVLLLPAQHINLLNGVIESFSLFFQTIHLPWLTPIFAALIAFGSLASLSAWLIGPARGMQNACQYYPALTAWLPLNARKMPHRILLLQACICSLFTFIFLGMPSLNSAFWFLITLTSQFTVLMYILVFLAAVRLRFRYPNLNRPFKIPGGTPTVSLIAGLGVLACGTGFLLGLFPPKTIGIHHTLEYTFSVLLGDAILLLAPLCLLHRQNKRS